MRNLTLAIVVLGASACSGGSSGSSSSSGTGAGSSTGVAEICIPGQSVECLGSHCTGMQTCLPDGTEGPCVCPTTTGTTGGTTGASTTGTTGGQTSGGGTGSTSGGMSGTGGTSSGTTGGPSAIGRYCDDSSSCPGSQYCFLTMDQHGFCTISCGQGSLAPPDGGEQLCADTPAVGGTPACEATLATDNSDGGFTFYCGLTCGLGDAGPCPARLTCTDYLCE